jgi:uncharacterized protein
VIPAAGSIRRSAPPCWEDEHRLEVPARAAGEARSMVIGMIAGTHWSAVVTYRGETTRIISVRRSRREEVSLYEEDQGR